MRMMLAMSMIRRIKFVLEYVIDEHKQLESSQKPAKSSKNTKWNSQIKEPRRTSRL